MRKITDEKMTENVKRSLSFSIFCSIIFTFDSVFNRKIKFGKAKQKVITLIAAALEALFAVSQASGRVSRCKLNTGNVYDFFL